jgi:hypothetical protein
MEKLVTTYGTPITNPHCRLPLFLCFFLWKRNARSNPEAPNPSAVPAPGYQARHAPCQAFEFAFELFNRARTFLLYVHIVVGPVPFHRQTHFFFYCTGRTRNAEDDKINTVQHPKSPSHNLATATSAVLHCRYSSLRSPTFLLLSTPTPPQCLLAAKKP